MATIFLDPSALVRRYDPLEVGASGVRAICLPRQGHDLLVSRLAMVEVASAFGRKAREGRFDRRARGRVWRTFNSQLLTQYRVIDLTDAIYASAVRVVLAHALRAADAVHIASAPETAAVVPGPVIRFWTADRRQADVAAAEGLDVGLVR